MKIVLLVVRRLAVLATTLLVASLAIFAGLAAAPGDSSTALAGGRPPDPRTLQQLREQYHLDDPFWSQYWHWLLNIVTGNLGDSVVMKSSVASLISSRAMNTVALVTYAALIILIVGIGLGTLAALRGGWANSAIMLSTSVAMAAPSFVVAIAMIWLFSSKLTWLPIYGSGHGFGGKIEHLTLPAISLAFTYIAYVTRITRTSVVAELESEHVDTAVSRGAPRGHIVRHHVLRNASAPILAISGLTVAGLFAGTAVAEKAFGVSGLGSLLVESAIKQDIAVVQVLAMIMVGAFVALNTLVDLLNLALDPRTRRTAS